MKYKIAVFPGDGVGPELIAEGIKLIQKAAELDKFEIEFMKFPHCAEYFGETNETLPEKVLNEIKNSCSAVYCGTFDNFPMETDLRKKNVPIILKNYFEQNISIRPIRLLPGVESPLAGKSSREIDFVIIRESSEDFYVGASGKTKNGKSKNQIEIDSDIGKFKFNVETEPKGNELAYQIGVMSMKGCDRIARYAFEYAKSKSRNKITFVDKADALGYYSFWRESIDRIAKEYPGIPYVFDYIDTAAMRFVRQPEKFEIIAAPNMFGDILQDLGTIIQGGLAFGAAGNLNPEGISMFEPVHASAAKLKGQDIINPIATIWAGALMLEHLGEKKSGALILKSIESVLKDGRTRTQDLDGHNSTSEMGDAIADKFTELHD